MGFIYLNFLNPFEIILKPYYFIKLKFFILFDYSPVKNFQIFFYFSFFKNKLKN
jgi:hypothetical protein